MVEKKTDAIDRIAIDHIVKLRDRLVVERLRLFRLKRAIDAYARTVDSELLECDEAGRELGAKIALPIWENVWKTSLLEEMRRVREVFGNRSEPKPNKFWNATSVSRLWG